MPNCSILRSDSGSSVSHVERINFAFGNVVRYNLSVSSVNASSCLRGPCITTAIDTSVGRTIVVEHFQTFGRKVVTDQLSQKLSISVLTRPRSFCNHRSRRACVRDVHLMSQHRKNHFHMLEIPSDLSQKLVLGLSILERMSKEAEPGDPKLGLRYWLLGLQRTPRPFMETVM